MPVAKIVHRGLMVVKIPFLFGFFFLSFVFPNNAMSNFQYFAYVLGGIFYATITIFILEVAYVNFQQLLDCHVAVRVIVAIVFCCLYGLGITCYVFTFLHTINDHVLGTTIITMVLNFVIFILSIVAPHTSSYVTAFFVFFQGFHFVYSVQVSFSSNSQFRFNDGCYYAFSSFAGIFNVLGIVCFNCVELTLRPLFNGIKDPSPPEFASFISDAEDDDMASPESTYHYWAFHLIMCGASCYMALFVCFP